MFLTFSIQMAIANLGKLLKLNKYVKFNYIKDHIHINIVVHEKKTIIPYIISSIHGGF